MAMASPEYFQWGAHKRRMACENPHAKHAAEVMENKNANSSHFLALSPHAKHAEDVMEIKYANSSHFLALPPETTGSLQNRVNDMMCTRSCNNTNRRKAMRGNGVLDLPKFSLSLSRSEKEEDFLTIKGPKLPLRPKKRLKSLQTVIDDLMPGGCLSDISQERYEVKEKK